MNEILLTHDQQGDAIDTALMRCTRNRELSPVHTVAEEVCHAQLAKVVEWLESLDCGDTCPLLQALREAAGEGK